MRLQFGTHDDECLFITSHIKMLHSEQICNNHNLILNELIMIPSIKGVLDI